MGYPYFFDFTMALTASILRGMKRSTYPMVTTMLCCSVLRIILIYTLFQVPEFHTIFWLYALFPLTWVLATLSNLVAIFIFIPKDLKKLDNQDINLEPALTK
jgi:Na+-driven multidrug efflux pump